MEGSGHQWKQEDFVAEFVERTTAQAEQRRVLFDVACDLVPFEPEVRIRVLDIGAGYGAFAAAVLDCAESSSQPTHPVITTTGTTRGDLLLLCHHTPVPGMLR